MAKAKRENESDAAELASATAATGERLYYGHAKAWVTVTKAYDDGTRDVQEEEGAGRFWAHLPEDALSTEGPE